MTRVLIGDFGALMRAGVEDLLRSGGLEVLPGDGDLVGRLLEELPDAVVLNLDDDACVGLAAQICTLFPAMTVIACSTAAASMRVFPRFYHGESYVSHLREESLAACAAS